MKIKVLGITINTGEFAYKAGYKYQTDKRFRIQTGIIPDEPIQTRFVDLDETGLLTIKIGYAWDGCSGPTIDTKNSMIAGGVHDAFYGLIRADLISQSRRKDVDVLFYNILLANGMWRIRAWYYYQAVRKFGLSASSAENRKKVHKAP